MILREYFKHYFLDAGNKAMVHERKNESNRCNGSRSAVWWLVIKAKLLQLLNLRGNMGMKLNLQELQPD